jgi:hypothetical protein
MNIALPTLACDESLPMVMAAFEAAEPIETGPYTIVAKMSGFTSGSWMVTLGGSAAGYHVNENDVNTSAISQDGEVTLAANVTSITDNKIRIAGRANPGGKLSIVSVTKD